MGTGCMGDSFTYVGILFVLFKFQFLVTFRRALYFSFFLSFFFFFHIVKLFISHRYNNYFLFKERCQSNNSLEIYITPDKHLFFPLMQKVDLLPSSMRNRAPSYRSSDRFLDAGKLLKPPEAMEQSVI
jgi:hypothetical protein